MKCIKKESRNLFNMLDIFSCENCLNKNTDYYFYLGLNLVNVYFLKECKLDEESLILNMKVIYILKEVIEKEVILFWFEDFDEFEELQEMIGEMDEDIIIVIEK